MNAVFCLQQKLKKMGARNSMVTLPVLEKTYKGVHPDT